MDVKTPVVALMAYTLERGEYVLPKEAVAAASYANQEPNPRSAALARRAQAELQRQFPQIGNLTADQQRLYGLQPVLERAVGKLGNTNVSMSKILNVPGVKSRIAFTVYNASKSGQQPMTIGAAGRAVFAYEQALKSGRGPAQTAQTLPMAAQERVVAPQRALEEGFSRSSLPFQSPA